MDIISLYKDYCSDHGITFEQISSIKPYDDSTLFCPAGMQQYKKEFADISHRGTVANVQACIRANDVEQLGDGSHLLYFNMIGLFSFRQMTVSGVIGFWITFIQDILKLKIDYVTIHPDKDHDVEWVQWYIQKSIPIKLDETCTWTDGTIGGYCTEFFVNGIEIGNIVNPLDTCIDVGFGYERLNTLVNGATYTEEQILNKTVFKLIEDGYSPSNLRQGYILRKLLRLAYKKGIVIDHIFYIKEVERQKKLLENYNKLKYKYKDKPKEWWFDTHGIDLDEINAI